MTKEDYDKYTKKCNEYYQVLKEIENIQLSINSNIKNIDIIKKEKDDYIFIDIYLDLLLTSKNKSAIPKEVLLKSLHDAVEEQRIQIKYLTQSLDLI